MSQRKNLSPPLTQKETVCGWTYLVLEVLFLPSVLQLLWQSFFPEATEATVNFLYYIMNFGAVTVIFRRFLRKSLTSAGKHLGRFLLYSLLGFILYWATSFLMGKLLLLIDPAFSNVNDSAIADMSQDGYIYMAIGTIILVPTAEECLFRGLLFRGFYEKGRWPAYLISILSFCAIHILGYIGAYTPLTLLLCFVQYIPAGLCLAWAYEKSDTIAVPILIHTVINAIGIDTLR